MDMLQDRPLKNLWIWKLPEEGHKYGLGIDISKGSGNDSSCIQVIDVNTYEQVAEYLGICTTHDLSKYAYDIANYYNCGYIILECNSIGEAVFNELYYNLNYPNMFKQKKDEKWWKHVYRMDDNSKNKGAYNIKAYRFLL